MYHRMLRPRGPRCSSTARPASRAGSAPGCRVMLPLMSKLIVRRTRRRRRARAAAARDRVRAAFDEVARAAGRRPAVPVRRRVQRRRPRVRRARRPPSSSPSATASRCRQPDELPEPLRRRGAGDARAPRGARSRSGCTTRSAHRLRHAMTLRELLGDGPDDVEITGLAYDNRAVEPGTLFFCVPGFTRDGHDFAPDAVARGAAALVVAAAARARRARGRGRRRARRDGAGRGALPRRSDGASCASSGSPAPTARRRRRSSSRALLEAAGLPMRAARHRRRRSSAGEERPVVRTTPEAIDLQAHVPRDARRGDVRLRDGGLLARARAAPRRRRSTSPPRCSPTSRQDHLDFHPDMEDYFPAKRLLFASPLDAARGSSTPTTRTGAGWPRSSRTR